MRNVFVLVKNNLRILILKKPVYTLLVVVFPLIISLFMFKVMNNGVSPLTIGVVDKDNTFTSNKIINSFDKNMFNIINIQESDIESKFSSKEVNLVVSFDNNFEENILNGNDDGIIIRCLENENYYKLINKSIGIEVSNLINLAKVNNGNYEKYEESVKRAELETIKINKEHLNDVKGDYENVQVLIGFIIMFALYRAMSGSALINEDKEQNVYTRILVASIKTWQYYLANIFSVILLLIILFGLTILGMNFIIDADLGLSNLQLFIILSLVAIVAVSIGTFCTNVTNDRDLSSILSTTIMIVFSALGGCFVPIKYLSPIINKVSYLTPIRWALEMVNNIQQKASLNIILIDAMILILFATTFFIAAIYCINKRDKTDYII